jgi:predicted PurR-regulated permease PerM
MTSQQEDDAERLTLGSSPVQPTEVEPGREPDGDNSGAELPGASLPGADLPGADLPSGDISGGGVPLVAPAEPMVVPRWVQAVVVAVALFAVAGVARAAAPVVLVFLVAAVVALIINPLVTWLQHVGLPRGIAIAAVFVGFFAAVTGAVALLVRPMAAQAEAFRKDLPSLISSANAWLADVQDWLDERGIGIQVKRPGDTALETLQSSLLRSSRDVVAFTGDLVTGVAEAGFVLILILVIAIYMLVYGEKIGGLARQLMPPGNGTVDDDYPALVQRAVFGYVRGQLVFSLIMGLSAGVALWLFGVLGLFPAGRTYAVFFGAFYGLMELIPYLGPVLGATPPLLVAVFQGEPLTALWLVLLFVALQQLEGHVVAPQVFGHSLRINPLMVMFALLLGGELQGIPGALLALPLAAVVRETVLYLRRHLVLEPWGTPTAAALRNPPKARTRPAPQPQEGDATWAGRLAASLRDRWARRRARRRRRDRDEPSVAQDSPPAG